MRKTKPKKSKHPCEVCKKPCGVKIERKILIKSKFTKEKIKDRVPTGIINLDEVIEGGLKRKSIALVGGCPGSGKTIFAIQFLINGIKKYNEPGVYICFEEAKENIYRDMLRFGWDLEKLEKEGKFAFLAYTPQQVKKIIAEGGGTVETLINKIKAKRVVIDSLTAFTLLEKSDLAKRESCLALFKMIRLWGCTAMVIGEYGENIDKYTTGLEFEVDSIIWLYNLKVKDIRVRAIEVFKMRGTKHTARTFPFKITEEGIKLYPEQKIFS